MIFDTHAHLTCEELIDKAPALIENAKKAGVSRIVNICTDEKSLIDGLQLHKQYSNTVFLSAATTPHDVQKEGASFFPIVEKCAKERQLVAIGETGLDYFYTHSPIDMQKTYLSAYFRLAISCALPIIFHCREAFADLFSMADKEYKDKPALLHCFTGSLEEARGVLDRGWLLSISGIATYKKSDTLREVIRYVPLDRLTLETDAPYLAPQSHRGKQNEPAYILETATLIASLKNLSVEEVAHQTTLNAKAFFSV
ncbi:MAG: hypothetical protein RLZZ453_566 [Chlamydiota bacterium]|jgi:TatD DNase family protein